MLINSNTVERETGKNRKFHLCISHTLKPHDKCNVQHVCSKVCQSNNSRWRYLLWNCRCITKRHSSECVVLPRVTLSAGLAVAVLFTDIDKGMTPTRTELGVTQLAFIELLTTTVTLVFPKWQDRRVKHGPETVIGDPPSNDTRLGEMLIGSTSNKQ